MIKLVYDMDAKFTFRALLRIYQKRLLKIGLYGVISLGLLLFLIFSDAHILTIGAGYGAVFYYVFSFSSCVSYYHRQAKSISKDMKDIEFEVDEQQLTHRFSVGITDQVTHTELNQITHVKYNSKGLWIKSPKFAIIVMNGTFSEGSYDVLIQKLQALPNISMKKI